MYKINYDEKNWNLLTATLNSDSYSSIPTFNRIQLIQDSSDLAWRGDLNYTIHFNILKYLQREQEYLPWATALQSAEALNKMLKKTSAYGMFKVRTLVLGFKRIKTLLLAGIREENDNSYL